MTARKGTRSVRLSREAVRALASPLRMEIVQSFDGQAAMTVEDLARRVGKQKESLYYHVRKLVAAGVLVESERRLKGRRYESLYRTAGPRLEMAPDPATPDGEESFRRLTGSIVRTAARELETAVARGRLAAKNARPAIRRARARLTAADLGRIETLYREIEELCAARKKNGRGRMYALTLLMVPTEDAE